MFGGLPLSFALACCFRMCSVGMARYFRLVGCFFVLRVDLMPLDWTSSVRGRYSFPIAGCLSALSIGELRCRDWLVLQPGRLVEILTFHLTEPNIVLLNSCTYYLLSVVLVCLIQLGVALLSTAKIVDQVDQMFPSSN